MHENQRKKYAETPTSRHEDSILTTWPRSEQKSSSYAQAFHPPLSFPSQAKFHPLEQEHIKLIKQVKGIIINTPFIESLAKVPEYAKFL